MNLTNEQIQALKAAAEVIATGRYTDDQWFRYQCLVHQINIPSLLAERDADKEKIATLQSRNRRLEGIITAAEKRIAELGASLKAAEINETDARCHVAELEGRTLTVKFPEADIGEAAEFGGGAVVVPISVIRETLAAAGITLVVGGE